MPSEFGGSSLAGGHALSVAAVDRRIRAAVAQVPFISGSGNLTRLVRPETSYIV
ncbi:MULTISPECIES: acetylxylan esterase [unclassified Rhodococcus (in: high G+C Gram-positive bacteria)]|jgi:cephalosporin-C deacetylase-like acetyl esterase|uniref:acetylxylan esterase n=1 Tax=unclassified Rhodococcus (in: high G+C Gram-positive bacteria) TaxID=192944 RepID=UPI001F24A020|nr:MULTISPECIES: acetylxylan esterase [unclassified Rhodococcus (in: high G+C Gram-positive bacteria)]